MELFLFMRFTASGFWNSGGAYRFWISLICGGLYVIIMKDEIVLNVWLFKFHYNSKLLKVPSHELIIE